MKRVSFVFVSLCLLFGVLPGFCQENIWKQLEPLKSTRQQVERLIGKPIKHFMNFGIYSNDPLLEYTVWYSKGNCDSKASETLYDVPAGLLTRLHITLRSGRKLADFEKELDKFTRKEFDELKGHAFYYSADEALTYKAYIEKDGSETLVSIAIQPGKEMDKLRCKGSGPSLMDILSNVRHFCRPRAMTARFWPYKPLGAAHETSSNSGTAGSSGDSPGEHERAT